MTSRTFAILILALGVAPLPSAFLAERSLGAADDPKATDTAGELPAVYLSHGGPRRTGSVSGARLPKDPVVQWTTELAASPGEPLLAEGGLYVGDTRGNVYALNVGDGSVRWKFAAGHQVFEAPALRGDRLYFTSQNGLAALAREDGRVRWINGLVGDATGTSPLIVQDRIVVAGSNGKVSAVDFDGKLIWQHDIVEDAPPSPPGFDGERARVGGAARPRTAACDGTTVFLPIFDQSRIAAIDLKAGRRRWSYQAKGWINGAPAVTDGRVFFGSQDRHLYCLDKRRKTFHWSFPTKSRIEAGPAYRDGSVYFGSCDGRFYRVNAETGREIWSYQTPRAKGTVPAIYSAPLCTEDSVYFGSFDGHLYGLALENGALRWRVEAAEDSEITSSPLTDGQRLFVAIRRRYQAKGRGQDAVVAIAERK